MADDNEIEASFFLLCTVNVIPRSVGNFVQIFDTVYAEIWVLEIWVLEIWALEIWALEIWALEIWALEIWVLEIWAVRDMGIRDMGVRDMGVRDMGVRDMGIRDMGVRDMGVRDMGVRDPGNTTCCTLIKGKGKAIPVQEYYRPCGFQEVEAPFLDNQHMKVVMLSALRTGRTVLIFVRV